MKYISLIISSIALIISVSFSICNESFSSTNVFLSIISVCATLIVGVHFLDSWTIQRMNEKISKLTGLEEELKHTKEHANIALHITTAIGFMNWKPKQAYNECWKAFEMSIAQNDAVRANTSLDCLENFNHACSKNGAKIPSSFTLSEQTLSSPLYKVFRKRVNELSTKTNILKTL